MSDPIQQIRAALDSGRLTVNRMDDGTAVVLDVEGEQLMTLNATGLRILDWIEEDVESVKQLTEMLVGSYSVSVERARHDLDGFLKKLSNALT